MIFARKMEKKWLEKKEEKEYRFLGVMGSKINKIDLRYDLEINLVSRVQLINITYERKRNQKACELRWWW